MKRIITPIKNEKSFKNKYTLGYKEANNKLYYSSDGGAKPLNASRIASSAQVLFDTIKPNIDEVYGEDDGYWVTPDSEFIAQRAKLIKAGIMQFETTYTLFRGNDGYLYYLFNSTPLTSQGYNSSNVPTMYYAPLSGNMQWMYRVPNEPGINLASIRSVFDDTHLYNQFGGSNFYSDLHAETPTKVMFDHDRTGNELLYPTHAAEKNTYFLHYLAARAWRADHLTNGDPDLEDNKITIQANSNGYNARGTANDRLNYPKSGHITKVCYARYVGVDQAAGNFGKNMTVIGGLTSLMLWRDYEAMNYLMASPYAQRIDDAINNAVLNNLGDLITYITVIQSDSKTLVNNFTDDDVIVSFDFDEVNKNGLTRTNYPIMFTQSEDLQIIDSNLKNSKIEDGKVKYSLYNGTSLAMMPYFNVLCKKGDTLTKMKIVLDMRQSADKIPTATDKYDKIRLVYSIDD